MWQRGLHAQLCAFTTRPRALAQNAGALSSRRTPCNALTLLLWIGDQQLLVLVGTPIARFERALNSQPPSSRTSLASIHGHW